MQCPHTHTHSRSRTACLAVAGADVNAADKGGVSVLHHAVDSEYVVHKGGQRVLAFTAVAFRLRLSICI